MENNKGDCSLGCLALYIFGMMLVFFLAFGEGVPDGGRSFNWFNAGFIVLVLGGWVTWMFITYLRGPK